MSNSNIVTNYGFDSDSLIVSFAEIIVIHVEEAEDMNINDEFQTDEKVYQLSIKQKGGNKNTVTLVAESVIKDFKEKYTKYLDYKLQHPADADTVVSKVLNDSSNFFDKMEEKINATLNNVIKHSEDQIEKIVSDSTTILDDNRTYNKEISEELSKLKALQNTIENFVLEEELVGEVLPK